MLPFNSLRFFKIFLFLIIFLSVSCTTKRNIKASQISDAAIISEEAAKTFNPKDYPLILRRTTLIVRDIETSLAFYKDAIGMEVIYDNLIRRPHKTEDREEVLRLIFLKSVHNFYGVLGLLEYDVEYPNKKIKPIRKEGFTAGNIVLLFNTNDIGNGFKKLENAKGTEVIRPPELREFPSYDGTSKIRVMMSAIYDPDGFLVEFNQLLDDIK